MLRGHGLTRSVTVPVSAGLLTDTLGYFDALTAYRAGDPGAIVEKMAHASFAGIANGRQLVEIFGPSARAGRQDPSPPWFRSSPAGGPADPTAGRGREPSPPSWGFRPRMRSARSLPLAKRVFLSSSPDLPVTGYGSPAKSSLHWMISPRVRVVGVQSELQHERTGAPVWNAFKSPGRRTAAEGRQCPSAPGRIRTCDQRVRSALLYPLSYGGASQG